MHLKVFAYPGPTDKGAALSSDCTLRKAPLFRSSYFGKVYSVFTPERYMIAEHQLHDIFISGYK
jgi:hypothetical protein